MTTAGEIVRRAFRENNLLGTDKSPTPTQEAEACRRLSAFVESMINTEVARYLHNWTMPNFTTSPVKARQPLYPRNIDIPSDKWPYPPANVRLIIKLESNRTVYFQQLPTDGAQMALVNLGPPFGTHSLRLDGNGYMIEGAPVLDLNSDPQYTGSPLRWMFRADLGSWERLTFPFEPTTEMPFPTEFDDFFTAALAVRISPLYGKETSAVTQAVAANGIEMIRARYYQDTPDANLSEPFVFNSFTSFGGPENYGDGGLGA